MSAEGPRKLVCIIFKESPDEKSAKSFTISKPAIFISISILLSSLSTMSIKVFS